MSQLTISDSVLSALSRRADVIREFPFVKLNLPASKGCKCRQAPGARDALTREFERVKQTINNLPADRLARFKAILGANQLTMYIRGPKGVVGVTR